MSARPVEVEGSGIRRSVAELARSGTQDHDPFPPLAEVEPWDWGETDEGEPVVMIERHATFTGVETGAVDLTAPIPNTAKIGVWRIEPSGHYVLMGLMDDPLVMTAAEQAKNN